MRVAVLSLLATVLCAQGREEYWPGVSYDPAVPTLERVLGYPPGERISPHANIVRYFEALAAAQPARMRAWDYARSWEGRRLIYAAIGSEANIRRLPEIKAAIARLADPRKTSPAEAKKLMSTLPAVVWLGYGVHGNEISSPDAAMLTAYHLLAARRDPVVESILAQVIVLIDPLQNPDGRDRFVHHFAQAVGLEPSEEPLAFEHTEGWLSGRTNHYHFDMNRDWFALTQPETRGRVRTLLEWLPQVFVDLHEMGPESSYYFAPEAVPYNPHLTASQRSSLDWFGRNNSKWFDQFGFSYFTREIYDAFYPGYGASWPAFYGAIAMTYENGSARGLRMRRPDNTVFTFRDTVRRHFAASVATAETAATRRAGLLDNLWDYRVSAIAEGGREPVREFVLPRKADVSAVDKLASILADQGIEVHRATNRYMVRTAQPMKRMIRTLLDSQVAMEEEFVREQERRRKKKLPDEIYDVTAWSLPLMFNVEVIASKEVTPGEFPLVPPGDSVKGSISGRASVAYLAPWGTQASARLLTAALREGLRVHTSDKTFRQGDREFPRGTLVFRVSENDGLIHASLDKLARDTGAEVVATSTGWVDAGVNFGSRHVVPVKKPAVALAWDQPVAPGPAGHARFVLERQYGYPVVAVRTSLLNNVNLRRFDVLILPEGNYPSTFPAAVREWVQAGGTLIAIGGALRSFADPKTGWLAVRRERLPGEAPKKTEEPAVVPGRYLASEEEYEKAIAAEEPVPDQVAGVLVKARTDADHWLTAGLPAWVHALINSQDVYTPLKIDKGTNAVVFPGPAELLASGHLWEENRKLLAYKPLVLVQNEGRGHLIGFTADPNFRAYLDGMNLLFLNAVFRGPAHARQQ